MKIRIEATTPAYGCHYAEVADQYDDLTMWGVVENLIKPLLLAYGFHPDNVAAIGEVDEEENMSEVQKTSDPEAE